jgi:RNA polymerase sigma factor (TIGR02999 family)
VGDDQLNRVLSAEQAIPGPPDITGLLRAWTAGDTDALEQLAPLVDRELHRLASRYMTHERPGHTLQATALVNEAYVRLIAWKDVEWQNRAHFFGVAARLMRRILVDHARSRVSAKGGAGRRQVSLDEAAEVSKDGASTVIAVDEALEGLAAVSPRAAQVVEFRFFAGMTTEEAAEVLKVSTITVLRDWKFARSWLLREIARSHS